MSLKPLDLAIMTALAKGETHAYGIYLQMMDDGNGTLAPRDWSVYRQLPRLIKANLISIRERGDKAAYYLTTKGRSVLKAERQTLRHNLRLLDERI